MSCINNNLNLQPLYNHTVLLSEWLSFSQVSAASVVTKSALKYILQRRFSGSPKYHSVIVHVAIWPM